MMRIFTSGPVQTGLALNVFHLQCLKLISTVVFSLRLNVQKVQLNKKVTTVFIGTP